MLKVVYGNRLKKDLKIAKKRGLDMETFKKVVTMLANQEPLPQEYREHYLTNNFKRM